MLRAKKRVLDSMPSRTEASPLRFLAWLALTLLAVPLLAAEVYRSVDAQGRVVYSDRPGPDAELVHVATAPPSTPPPQTRSASPPAEPGADDLQGEVREERSPQELAAERERNCEVAQERATRYHRSQRLYRALPNGEREYLSDAELDAARAKADADVAAWCD